MKEGRYYERNRRRFSNDTRLCERQQVLKVQIPQLYPRPPLFTLSCPLLHLVRHSILRKPLSSPPSHKNPTPLARNIHPPQSPHKLHTSAKAHLSPTNYLPLDTFPFLALPFSTSTLQTPSSLLKHQIRAISCMPTPRWPGVINIRYRVHMPETHAIWTGHPFNTPRQNLTVIGMDTAGRTTGRGGEGG